MVDALSAILWFRVFATAREGLWSGAAAASTGKDVAHEVKVCRAVILEDRMSGFATVNVARVVNCMRFRGGLQISAPLSAPGRV